MNFRNKNILVLGFGISGQAAARFLLRGEAFVTVVDQKPLKNFRKVLSARPFRSARLKTLFGRPPAAWPRLVFLSTIDGIVLSPGVPLNSPILLEARRRKIPIVGELGLATEYLKTPMIAVTGTNGKSTTVTLIAEILKRAGKKVALGGNIGKPLLDIVMEKKKYDWAVVEVSSYQLETVRRFHPKISVLLNITEDHLDRYRSMKEYAQAKFRIFKEQGPRDLLIYKEDDAMVKKGAKTARARKKGFRTSTTLPTPYSLNRVKLVGRHNIENMTASILAARAAGVSAKVIQKTLENFEGLPHRTEFVREWKGVRFYDDSKGTNVDAVVKSLEGFPDAKVILLAGGRDKGGSYLPLRKVARRKLKALIAFGESRNRLVGSLKKSTAVQKTTTLPQAVRQAAQRAERGDVVLLSPACSSFDQFRDYKERGEVFQKCARDL